MHARLGGARQASTRPQRDPSRAVRGKPSGYTGRPSGAGNLAYLAAIGIAFLSAPASLLISGLVALYYVFEHTPARPGATLPGYRPIPGTSASPISMRFTSSG